MTNRWTPFVSIQHAVHFCSCGLAGPPVLGEMGVRRCESERANSPPILSELVALITKSVNDDIQSGFCGEIE